MEKMIPFHTFFNSVDKESLVTTFRCILSKFIIYKKIVHFDHIYLKPIKKKVKAIEFLTDQRGDVHLIENPEGYLLEIDSQHGMFTREHWYLFLESIKLLCKKRHKDIYLLVRKYIMELDINVFQNSFLDLDFIYEQVPSLKQEMIESSFLYYYKINHEKMKQEEVSDWKLMLQPHVESISFIFSQMINLSKKENIGRDVFKLATILTETDCDEFNIKLFKKEINEIVNNNGSYINTNKINFESWYYSLKKFISMLTKIQFNLALSILKLNTIFYLALEEVDELLKSNTVVYSFQNELYRYKKMSPSKLQRLKEAHPFLRTSYYHLLFKGNPNHPVTA